MKKYSTIEDILADDPFDLLKVKPSTSSTITADERLLNSFEEINKFFEQNNREPEPSLENIVEQQLYFRLKAIRNDNGMNFATMLVIFKAENKLGILPEEIVDELMPVILDKTYSPVQVQDAIRDIVTKNTESYNNLFRQVELLETIEDYENYPNSPMTRQEYQDTNPEDIADAKKELKKLRKVIDRKSYVERELDRRAKIKQKEIDSGVVQEELDL